MLDHPVAARADLHEDPTGLASPSTDARDPLQAEEMALMPAPPRQVADECPHGCTAPACQKRKPSGRTGPGDSCGIINKHELGRQHQKYLYFFVHISW